MFKVRIGMQLLHIFRKRFFLVIFILGNIIFSQAFAQSKIDSLEQILNSYSNKNGYEKQILSTLDELYRVTELSQPYLALEYAAQALQLSQKITDTIQIAGWNNKIGDIYFEQKVYYLAMESYSQAYMLFEKRKAKTEVAYSLINIGTTYYIQNIDDIAIDYFTKASGIFREINDREGVSITLDKIGLVYLRQYKYDPALANFKQSLQLREGLKNVRLTAQSYSYLAEAYKQLEDYEECINNLSSALKMYKLAGDILNVARTYNSIGDIYMKDDDYDNAKSNYEKALLLFTELSIAREIATGKIKIGQIYFTQNRNAEALKIAGEALAISNENNLLEQKKEIYLLFANAYIKQGKIKNAFDFLMSHSVVKDSIYDEKKQEQFSELQVSLATQKKEKEIEILKREDLVKDQELRRRKVENYGLFAGIALILIFAVYYFYTSRNEKRINTLLMLQNEEINLQKEEIQSSAENLEKANKEILIKKNEIEEINLKITASIHYASRIQQAMLTKVDWVKDFFSQVMIFHRPKEAVSGDFYWFATVRKPKPPSLFKAKQNEEEVHKVIVAVVDCTGHGVPGAFMAMLGDSYLNQIVNLQKISEPDKILNELHKSIRFALRQEETENNDGMDMALCVIDKANKTLEFAGAKNPLVYVQNGKIERINGDLMSIGGLQKEKERVFTKHTLDISVKTTVFVYSDGFQDQFGGDFGRKYMAKPFRDLLFEVHALPAEEQKSVLNTRLTEWMGSYKQMDDITIVGLTF